MSLNIMHIDMDAFFASVEQIDKPDLKGKPVIVGGTLLDKRGVVSAASYEARKYGVHSAMPIVKAKKLCPNGIFLPGNHQRYREMSKIIFNIFMKYTPLVEGISIDEAFLDLSGCHRLFGDSRTIGKKIKEEIKKETGLIASVGLASNKFLAKLSSDLDKPDGFFVIEENKVAEILDPLPVSKIWGVGKKTEKILKARGIETIARLKELSIIDLETLLGKTGKKLYHLSRGIDNRVVNVSNEIKSISHEETYSDNLTDRRLIYASLMKMTAKVSRRLRKNDLSGFTVFIKVRYNDFTTKSRSISLKVNTNSTDIIYQTARKLLEKDKLLDKPVRLLGIGVSNIKNNDKKQLSLFEDNIKKDELSKIIDNLKDRFGDSSIKRARNLENKL
ncbi:DNA polymerase IV [Natronospora cellulosivora (SeqCode)]